MSRDTEHQEQSLCQCGCGKPAPLATRTCTERGWVKGRPRRFITGHHRAKWRYIDNNGYVALYLPDHPNASKSGHVGEHVVVASCALGRPMPPCTEVHHVDGDKSNNAGSNLVVCPDHAYHALLELRTRALTECGHADWRRCVRCHEWADPMALTTHGKGSFVHRACRAAYRKVWSERCA